MDFRGNSISSSSFDASEFSTVVGIQRPSVSTPMLVAVSIACGAVALVVAFMAGQQEQRALRYSSEQSLV
jgi:predicted XRE-type DNA-binding protein